MPDMPKHDSRFPYLAENYAVFKRLEPQLLAEHSGRYALLANKELLGIHDSFREAYRAGAKAVGRRYIVQKIGARPVQIVASSRAGALG